MVLGELYNQKRSLKTLGGGSIYLPMCGFVVVWLLSNRRTMATMIMINVNNYANFIIIDIPLL